MYSDKKNLKTAWIVGICKNMFLANMKKTMNFRSSKGQAISYICSFVFFIPGCRPYAPRGRGQPRYGPNPNQPPPYSNNRHTNNSRGPSPAHAPRFPNPSEGHANKGDGRGWERGSATTPYRGCGYGSGGFGNKGVYGGEHNSDGGHSWYSDAGNDEADLHKRPSMSPRPNPFNPNLPK